MNAGCLNKFRPNCSVEFISHPVEPLQCTGRWKGELNTNTQIHKYTNTQIHIYTYTQIHKCKHRLHCSLCKDVEANNAFVIQKCPIACSSNGCTALFKGWLIPPSPSLPLPRVAKCHRCTRVLNAQLLVCAQKSKMDHLCAHLSSGVIVPI